MVANYTTNRPDSRQCHLFRVKNLTLKQTSVPLYDGFGRVCVCVRVLVCVCVCAYVGLCVCVCVFTGKGSGGGAWLSVAIAINGYDSKLVADS